MLRRPRFSSVFAFAAMACTARTITFNDPSPPPSSSGMTSTSFVSTGSSTASSSGATTTAGGIGGFAGGNPFGVGGFGGGVVTTSGGGFAVTTGIGGAAGAGGFSATGTGGSGPIAGAAGSGGSGIAGSGGGAGSGGSVGGSSAGGSSVDGGPDVSGGSKAVTYCAMPYPVPLRPTSNLLSDFEGDAGIAIQTIAPGGIWAMDTDGTGSTSLTIEPCGTSGQGMHFKGAGHSVWGADVAAALVSQLQPVDVSAYHGIGFVIRSAVSTDVIVRVLAPYSQPACGRCDDTVVGTECYSGYMINVPTTADNQMQVIPWQAFGQQAWGYKPPGSTAFDAANLVTFEFAFDKSVDFDVCIDDVKLIP